MVVVVVVRRWGWGAVNRNRMALVQEGKKLRGFKKKIKWRGNDGDGETFDSCDVRLLEKLSFGLSVRPSISFNMSCSHITLDLLPNMGHSSETQPQVKASSIQWKHAYKCLSASLDA